MTGSFQLRGLKGLWWEAGEYLDWPPLLAGAGYNFLMLCYTFCQETSLRWRNPIQAPEEAILQELVQVCTEHNIELCLAIHPFIGSQAWPPNQAGLDFHPTSGPEWFRHYWNSRGSGEVHMADPPLVYGDVDDLTTLVDKCRRAQSIGIHSFALCLDDIRTDTQSSRFTSLADAQVWLVTELWHALFASDPSTRLLLAPTHYWSQAMDEHEEYVSTLANGIPAGVEVFWTGRDVRSQSITVDEARDAAGRLGREPVVWYNYASNDSFRFQLLFPPGSPPEFALASETAGLLVNPMRQVRLTRLHVLVMGEYLTNPESYDHQGAMDRAIQQLADGEAGEALARFIAVWGVYPDSRTLSARLTQGGKTYLNRLVKDLDQIVSEINATAPILDQHLQDRVMYSEIREASQRARLLCKALRLRQQEQDGGTEEHANSLQALEREMGSVSEEMACDARTVLDAPIEM